MIISRKLVRALAFFSGSILAACTTTTATKPALINAMDTNTQDVLTRAVSKVIGVPVTLAPDSFTAKPYVTIEPASVNKRGGQIIDGRTMERPSQIDLVMTGKNCFVVNRDTGQRQAITGIDCKAAPKP